MSAEPSVSVICPFLNAERTLGQLLPALAAQLPPAMGEVEFIFVDNGSTDGGAQLVRDAALHSKTLVSESKPGVCAARNRGLAIARGDVLALIDSDCVPSRRWLRELVEPFNDPGVHLSAGGGASFPPRTAAQRFVARYGMNDNRRTIEQTLPYANGRNMAVRRASALAVGGWPEEMLQGDDIEFSTRILARFPSEIVYRENAFAYHQDRATDEELWKQALGYGRGAALVYARHPDRLPWGTRQEVERWRMRARRRLTAVWLDLGVVMGFSTTDDREFVHYLVRWDHWWWRGFNEERRRSSRSAAT